MHHVVLDTNALIQSLPTRSRYHKIWTDSGWLHISWEPLGQPRHYVRIGHYK